MRREAGGDEAIGGVCGVAFTWSECKNTQNTYKRTTDSKQGVWRAVNNTHTHHSMQAGAHAAAVIYVLLGFEFLLGVFVLFLV